MITNEETNKMMLSIMKGEPKPKKMDKEHSDFFDNLKV